MLYNLIIFQYLNSLHSNYYIKVQKKRHKCTNKLFLKQINLLIGKTIEGKREEHNPISLHNRSIIRNMDAEIGNKNPS